MVIHKLSYKMFLNILQKSNRLRIMITAYNNVLFAGAFDDTVSAVIVYRQQVQVYI